MNDIPVFAVRTAEAFYEQLLASQPDPATGELDKAKMEAFLAANPETARAVVAKLYERALAAVTLLFEL